jgi:hypothetical protein
MGGLLRAGRNSTCLFAGGHGGRSRIVALLYADLFTASGLPVPARQRAHSTGRWEDGGTVFPAMGCYAAFAKRWLVLWQA